MFESIYSMSVKSLLYFAGSLLLLASCSSSKKLSGTNTTVPISSLKLINEFVYPSATFFKGTLVGGLSGIDYDKKRDVYYLIVDDRSDRSPERFYTARIRISEKGIDTVEFIDVTTLRDKDGNPYPPSEVNPAKSPDPESIRYNPITDELIWGSEGDRAVNEKDTVTEDPGIYIVDRNGRYKDSFALPRNLHTQSIEKGPRRNGGFEGITFSPDYKHLFASVELPLYEDGLRAGSGDSSAWVRFIKFNTRIKEPVAQYAYQIEPIAHVPNPPGGFRINGISEILNIGEDLFIVMERSYSMGTNSNAVRLFLADAHNADDITGIASLDPMPAVRPISKKLLLDMDSLGRYIDNVEGMTFGPLLANGHRSLIFVVDDNFDKTEKIQFFLFEVIP